MDALDDQTLAAIAASFGNIGSMKTFFKFKIRDLLFVIRWCQFYGLIAKEYKCPVCDKQMRLTPRKDRSDQFVWTCRITGDTKKHYIKRSIRTGTWFEQSRLSITEVLIFAYMWCANLPSSFLQEELVISPNTVNDWSKVCREMSFEILMKAVGKIGGPGIFVEIDKGKLGQKKFLTGEAIEGKWIFAGIEGETGRCFFAAVKELNCETLLLVIKEHILPETILISNCWKTFNCLSHEGFINLESNEGLTFIESNTDKNDHPQKWTWSAIKNDFYNFHNVDGNFDSYLAEYIYRKSNVPKEEKVRLFFSTCARLYPPHTKDITGPPPKKKLKK